jgi:hypothetical protein
MKANCRAYILIFALAFPGLLLTGCNWDDHDSAAAQTAPAESTPAASSPVISGTPATSIPVGASYMFRPVASDPDGQALTFAIKNKPAWAAFDTATGVLAGTPSVENVGTYAQIAISVSDGAKIALLAPFSIDVARTKPVAPPGTVAPPKSAVTVSWTSPTLNTNGTTVTDLAGYHIYYGPTSTQLNQVIDVAGADVTTFVLSNISAGTWYFAVAAYNSDKVESNLSAVLPIAI